MGNGACKEDYSCSDVPDQSGKVVLIAGASAGPGFALVKDYVHRTNARKVILACADASAASAALGEVGARACVLRLDLADLDDVKKAPGRLLALGVDVVDTLVLHAGGLNKVRTETKQCHEQAFGWHLGQFALTAHLWPMLAPQARVVSVAGAARGGAGLDLEDLDWTKRPYRHKEAHFQATVCAALFATELARRAKQRGSTVTVACASLAPSKGDSPQWVKGLLVFGLIGGQDCAKLSSQTLRAATALEVTPVAAQPAQDELAAASLWAKSEQLSGVAFAV